MENSGYTPTFKERFDTLVSSRAFNLSLVLLMVTTTGVTVFFAQRQNYLSVLTKASSEGQEASFTVVVPTDVVNEDGSILTIADSANDSSWIGTGSHPEKSYLGIMFKGSGVPITSRVLSARIELYSVATQWLEVDSTIYVEDIELPELYTLDAPPSTRKATLTQVTYETNDKWKADGNYRIDVTKPIQELFKNHPSVRVVNIIMKGNGQKMGKKYIYNEQGSARSPKLIITYE
jgi:hypothetical protein